MTLEVRSRPVIAPIRRVAKKRAEVAKFHLPFNLLPGERQTYGGGADLEATPDRSRK